MTVEQIYGTQGFSLVILVKIYRIHAPFPFWVPPACLL